MSPAEVAHRSYRAARHPFDVTRMRAGLYARVPADLRDWRGPRTFYFDGELARTPISPALQERADLLCQGKREVLGLGWLDLPGPPWHVEPCVGGTWPRIDAARSLGSAPPGFDPRLTWEINRGHEWVVLARGWAATRNQRYRDRLDHELASWREHNRIGVGINWASPMEAAIRIHSLAWVAAFLRGEDLSSIASMLYEHATFVRHNLSKFSSANNHLIVELSGLIVAARCLWGVELGTSPALPWHTRAVDLLEKELGHQLFRDGVNAEMATHYHVFVLEALVLVAWLERRCDCPRPAIEQAIARMAAYVRELVCADGRLLQQGDDDGGAILGLVSTRHEEQILDAAEALAASTQATTGDSERALFWLANGAGAAPSRRPTRSRHFAASGQVILRSPDLVAALDAGSFGLGALAAHAHCDSLAIQVAASGRRMLVDRGTGRYNGDPATRDRFRATAAHNTAQLGTREPAEATGPFIGGRRSDANA